MDKLHVAYSKLSVADINITFLTDIIPHLRVTQQVTNTTNMVSSPTPSKETSNSSLRRPSGQVGQTFSSGNSSLLPPLGLPRVVALETRKRPLVETQEESGEHTTGLPSPKRHQATNLGLQWEPYVTGIMPSYKRR